MAPLFGLDAQLSPATEEKIYGFCGCVFWDEVAVILESLFLFLYFVVTIQDRQNLLSAHLLSKLLRRRSC